MRAPQLSVTDVTGLLLALFALGSTVANVLLWMTTRQSIAVLRRQSDYLESSVKSETLHRLTSAHRDIFLTLLGNDRALNILATDAGQSSDEYLRDFMATLLINHVADVYNSYTHGHLDEGEWLGMQVDIADLFTWPIMEQRWPRIRAFYSEEFGRMIDEVMQRVTVDQAGGGSPPAATSTGKRLPTRSRLGRVLRRLRRVPHA